MFDLWLTCAIYIGSQQKGDDKYRLAFGHSGQIVRSAIALSLMLSLSMTLMACSKESDTSTGGGLTPLSETSEPRSGEDSSQDAESADSEQLAEFDNWTSSATDNPVNLKWSAKEVSSFKGDKHDVRVSYSRIPFDNEEKRIVATDGSLIMDGAKFDSKNSYAIPADRTLYSVATIGGDINRFGLVEPDGEVLIECEAAGFDGFPSAYGQMRFLGVWYVGDEASEPSIANMEIDGTSYEVKLKIYDLEKRAFVGGVELANATSTLYNLGDCFAVTESNQGGSGKTTLFDANGTAVWSFDSDLVKVGPDYIVFDNYPHTSIVDTSGNVTFTAGEGRRWR
jgi:hypothetical protein